MLRDWSLAGRAVAESLADSAAALVFFAVGDAGGVPGIGSGGPHGTTGHFQIHPG